MCRTEQPLTGILEIDAQHRTLYDSLARIESAITGREKWYAVHYALAELADFARIHFAVEESLMRLHGYPKLQEHIDEHREFVRKLDEFQERSVRVDVSGDMVEFLCKWLAHHIGKVDQAYVPHLRKLALAECA